VYRGDHAHADATDADNRSDTHSSNSNADNADNASSYANSCLFAAASDDDCANSRLQDKRQLSGAGIQSHHGSRGYSSLEKNADLLHETPNDRQAKSDIRSWAACGILMKDSGLITFVVS